MKLIRCDLQDIDDLARLDCRYDENFFPHRQASGQTKGAGPGLLNHWRAFHIVWRLGLIGASRSSVRAALRENWPEAWRANEGGARFGDRWFRALAEHALKEHELRQTLLPPPRRRGQTYTRGTSMPERRNPTCLIVDDDALTQKYFSILVERAGYEVCGTAREGREAIDKAIELEPAVILMDVRLSGDMDGIDAAREIRHRLETRMIFISGMDDAPTIDRINRDYPSTILAKPVAPEDLIDALRR